MKHALKQFLILLLVGQIFLMGAAASKTIKNDSLRQTPSDITMSCEKPTIKTQPDIENTYSRKSEIVELIKVTHRMDEPYQMLEFDFSLPITVKQINRAGKLMRLRVSPAVKDIASDTEKSMAALFESFSHFKSSAYSEFVFAGKGSFGEPIIATAPNGLPRLTLPFRSGDVGFPLIGGESIAAGLTYYTDRPATKSGLSDAYILRIDPFAKNLAIFPVLANEGICQKEILSSMANRYKAIAGINAAYFTQNGEPIGTLIIDRRLVSSPLYNRSVFGLSKLGRPLFGNPDFSGVFKSDGISVEIDAVNQPRIGNMLVVYTPEYARSTLTTEEGIELTLVKGRVVGIHKADSVIPPDGVVVSAGGRKAAKLAEVKLARLVTLDYNVSPPWNDVQHAVCGGPRLLSEGRVDINGMTEKFQPTIQKDRHPRTAVALTASGDLLFVVIDGRSKRSVGMTLAELASYLKKLGALYAINLDGGGSSSMFVRNRIVNHPSDGKERPISNAILITTR